jgi:hypothetical protein
MVMAEMPATLFKYQPFDMYSLQNLKAQSVYFGSPLNFNDPYDCGLSARFGAPTEEEIGAIVESYLARPDLSDEFKLELTKKSKEQLTYMFTNAAQNAAADQRKLFADEYGIACFTESKDNLLMWGHYGGRFKGFCLEYRTDCEMFQKAFKVTYFSDIPVLNVASIITSWNFAPIIEMYAIKAIDWQYEREWRVFHKVAGTQYGYDAKTLKAVYFGPDIDPQAREIVCLVLGGQNPQVEYWIGRRSTSQYKIEFEKITYTSHLDAKKLGLL